MTFWVGLLIAILFPCCLSSTQNKFEIAYTFSSENDTYKQGRYQENNGLFSLILPYLFQTNFARIFLSVAHIHFFLRRVRSLLLQESEVDRNWLVVVVIELLLLLTSGATVFTYMVCAQLGFGLLVLCCRSCTIVCRVHECNFAVINCSLSF